ncbi:unnamed protein product [Amoebophrya sp. A25]|nr:unnamed protein product [Amoebophrya sp. A25]|eukprot:GSA25T00024944001.1
MLRLQKFTLLCLLLALGGPVLALRLQSRLQPSTSSSTTCLTASAISAVPTVAVARTLGRGLERPESARSGDSHASSSASVSSTNHDSSPAALENLSSCSTEDTARPTGHTTPVGQQQRCTPLTKALIALSCCAGGLLPPVVHQFAHHHGSSNGEADAPATNREKENEGGEGNVSSWLADVSSWLAENASMPVDHTGIADRDVAMSGPDGGAELPRPTSSPQQDDSQQTNPSCDVNHLDNWKEEEDAKALYFCLRRSVERKFREYGGIFVFAPTVVADYLRMAVENGDAGDRRWPLEKPVTDYFWVYEPHLVSFGWRMPTKDWRTTSLGRTVLDPPRWKVEEVFNGSQYSDCALEEDKAQGEGTGMLICSDAGIASGTSSSPSSSSLTPAEFSSLCSLSPALLERAKQEIEERDDYPITRRPVGGVVLLFIDPVILLLNDSSLSRIFGLGWETAEEITEQQDFLATAWVWDGFRWTEPCIDWRQTDYGTEYQRLVATGFRGKSLRDAFVEYLVEHGNSDLGVGGGEMFSSGVEVDGGGNSSSGGGGGARRLLRLFRNSKEQELFGTTELEGDHLFRAPLLSRARSSSSRGA